jgi:hypothetical protein
MILRKAQKLKLELSLREAVACPAFFGGVADEAIPKPRGDRALGTAPPLRGSH